MRTRLLLGLPCLSLAALAVLGASTPTASAAVPLADPAAVGGAVAAAPADADCGRPASPAVYGTVEHPAVVTAVPAVTHLEWRWERSVPTTELAHARVVTPAQRTWAWSRTVDVVERQFVRRVVDQPFVPAVPATGHVETRVVTPAVVELQWEYRQQQTGRTRWEAPGWNAGAGGAGWVPTGLTRELEVVAAVTEEVWVVDSPEVPAVPEVAHDELTWVPDGAAAPAGSTATGLTRVAGSTTESVDLPDGATPDGAGWVRGDATETAAAVLETLWVRAGEAVPAGYDPTGASRPGVPLLEETAATSPLAPSGEGWTQVPGSEVVVVDVEGYDRVDVPAWVEDFIVTPAVPGTAPCAAPAADGDAEDGGGDVRGAGEDAGDDPQVRAASATVRADVLPATGGPVEPWLVGLGAGSLLAGARLVRASRRNGH